MFRATPPWALDLTTLNQFWKGNGFMAFTASQDKMYWFTQTFRFYMYFRGVSSGWGSTKLTQATLQKTGHQTCD
jgi:hypothetical protein